jgi:pyruvate dehydrogenase (quinone)
VQTLEAVEQPPKEHGAIFSGVGYSDPQIVPLQVILQRAADVLSAGSKWRCWWAPATCSTSPTPASPS